MKCKKPRISIIIPIYNTPKEVLEECLYCLTYQSFEEYELICIDDCSNKTETRDIESEYEKNFPHIVKLFRLKNNIGAAEARNFGLSKAKGEYCIFLDSDDVFSKKYLENLYNKIVENDSDICLCGKTGF